MSRSAQDDEGEGPERLDADTFESAFRHHGPRVFALCLRMTGGDRDDAEELTQDVFVRIWAKRDQFHGGSLRAWIMRLAVNRVLNRLRSRSRRDRRLGEMLASEVPPAGHLAERTLESMMLEQAIAALPDGARTVLILFEIEGYPQSEIATLLGVSVGTVKSQLHRARRLLREGLS